MKKLPKTWRGAAVVRGKGMHYKKYEALVETHALDVFEAERESWLVVRDDLTNGLGPPKLFASYDRALAFARAESNGNVDHRVLRIDGQTLVVATENEL